MATPGQEAPAFGDLKERVLPNLLNQVRQLMQQQAALQQTFQQQQTAFLQAMGKQQMAINQLLTDIQTVQRSVNQL